QERTARIPGSEQRARRLPPQTLAESEANLPTLSVSDALATELLSSTGQEPSALQARIDDTLKPASVVLPGTRAEMRIVLAEQRRGISYNVLGLVEGSDP